MYNYTYNVDANVLGEGPLPRKLFTYSTKNSAIKMLLIITTLNLINVGGPV